jgi:hypothetical protein
MCDQGPAKFRKLALKVRLKCLRFLFDLNTFIGNHSMGFPMQEGYWREERGANIHYNTAHCQAYKGEHLARDPWFINPPTLQPNRRRHRPCR